MAYGKSEGRKIVNGKWIVSLFEGNVIRVEDADGCQTSMRTHTEVRDALDMKPLLDEDGFRIEVTPCCECDGQGRHAQHLGVISPSEWDDEDLQHYFDGHYDRTCNRCHGQGTVNTHVQCILECEELGESRCRCEDCTHATLVDEREARAVYRMESGLGWDW